VNALKAFALKARGRELEGPPIVLDMEGLPHSPCPACAGPSFHRAPDSPWRCSACAPALLPAAETMGGWQFCAVPEGGG
jgi:hypothetical protein